MGKRAPIDQQKWWKKLKDHRYIRVILFFTLGMILYLSMLSNVIPHRIDVSVGAVADQDIRAPITIENKPATEEKKRAAADAVGPQYTNKKDFEEKQARKIEEIFDLVSRINDEAEQKYNDAIEEVEQREFETEEELEEHLNEVQAVPIEEKLTQLRAIISHQTSDDLSDQTLITFLETDKSELNIARDITLDAIRTVMREEISLNDVDQAQDLVENKIVRSSVSTQKLYLAMIEIARFAITANHMNDNVATELAKQAARDAIEPVMIREGQLLVEEGDLITLTIYNQIVLLGLHEDQVNSFPFIGLAILVLLLVSMLAYYFSDAKTSLQKNNSHLLMYVLVFLVTVVIMKITSFTNNLNLQGITLIAPVAVGSMLLTMLIHQRVALFTSMVFSIVASIIFNSESTAVLNYTLGIYVFFSSVAGVFFLSKSNRVSRILQAGLFVSAINICTIVALLMLKNAQYGWIEIGSNIGFAFLSGFLAAVLTIGLLPFFEAGFGILSSMKLIELSNPNHPLFRKILVETPGTYHHSVMVANLSESACEAIGANGLLARVGSYYHDLGKTKRPHFFIENQMKMENPHDKLSPQLSKTIIISHPYDGAEMLRSYKMPKEIIDIAEQHHGTSLLKFFYHKANKDIEKPLPEAEFRYPGPKAQTVEAAVVGICDCIEAAVRSMAKPTPDKIELLVKKIITDRLEDGQFDECDLTLKQLNIIATSICETLKGTFHSRIEYPEDVKEKGEKSSDH
ncbi:HD family phosphohydrolase [Anaerobacillus sp. CMMVII]|uniref:HD family phosphohydrolase n=1 Tax=Anaerobacillus sp. CMMVII TaxID=2755588 RepID=UPI0021B7DB11|nr:HD family phosphohydrolase [Anaerobacillus sp. CMMVII]MCT8139683.1 HD family phosphohydrolase [Anaerobacillus sp. CMMVII]